MKPFLKQVAEHYYNMGNIDKTCLIFPNRRSMVFFGKWLAETVKNDERTTPLQAPVTITMNDFFYRVGNRGPADRISLLLELYDCYKALNKNAEPLDEFIFWGDVILGDFDDTDKYLAEPDKLFTNVADFKDLQDTYSYLTEEQLNAILKFVDHFRKGGKLTVDLDSEKPNVKERFLKIWNLMYPLYVNFRKALTDKGMAYEGMVYRDFSERLRTDSAADILKNAFPHAEKFVFVGLNALNECEKTAMRKMRDAGIAEFCWDFSSSMLKDPENRASMFMSRNVMDFPHAFPLDTGEDSCVDNTPKIHLISISSSIGQTKQIPSILQEIAAQKTAGDMSGVGRLDTQGADTAIVLPDENLLIPVLNTIPEEIGSVNVTMGYPMSGSEIYGLMNNISSLQLHLRKRKDGWAFYHKQVWAIFNSGIFSALADDATREKVAAVKSEAKFYIPETDLKGTWLLDLIFIPVLENIKEANPAQIVRFCEYQLTVLNKIGAKLAEMPGMALEVNFAKQYYLSVNRLKSIPLSILPMTYMRLLQQLIGGVSVPFKGEPLKGLQIMGPLETRALDFTNLIILSCNEGVFPRRSVSSSFIPPEIRKGFGLPTYENQDAVWAYYFFRMIQRSENVWLIYDSRTEGLKSGEESRYIKQLIYQYKYKDMDRKVIRYSIGAENATVPIHKTEEDIRAIKSLTYSVSSINEYLSCPAMFYYDKIKGLKKEEDVAESLDNSMLGNVFHDTMWALYLGGAALSSDFCMERDSVEKALTQKKLVPLEVITAEYIDGLLEEGGVIRAKIRALIKAQLKADEVTGRNLVMENVLETYVRKTLTEDKRLMREKGVDRFRILGLEMKKYWSFGDFRFVGYIDRVDSFSEDVARIVDYKTGKAEENEVKITDPEKTVEALFSPETKFDKRPKIAFQLFAYDRFMEKDLKGYRVQNVIYPIQKLFSSGIMSGMNNDEFNDLVEERLGSLFAELVSPEMDFRRAEDLDTCKYCDFRKICGR